MDGRGEQDGRRGAAAHAACVLEVMAPKAGNVRPSAAFDDVSWRDFVISAQVVRPILDRAPSTGVGQTLFDAVAATQDAVGSNTNLGMLLLLVPMCAVPDGSDLSAGVATVLSHLTAEDASLLYAAIRRAQPGGLGTVVADDVAGASPSSLIDAMQRAAPHDAVARQYVTDFARVLEVLAPRLAALPVPLDRAIVTLHLEQMADEPDGLIRRKCGDATAAAAQARARGVLEAGWPDAPGAGAAFAALDDWLRADGHRRNPGTSADLVAAALFAGLFSGTLSMPASWEGELPPDAPDDPVVG